MARFWCHPAANRERARQRSSVKHRGVGYTYTELGAMIGVSRERARQIHRDKGKAELLRRAGLLRSPPRRQRR